MKVLCVYYPNDIRLAAGIKSLEDKKNFKFFCINGSVSKVNGEYKVLSKPTSVFISCVLDTTGKTAMTVLTSDAAFSPKTGKMCELEEFPKASVYTMLCSLLHNKFKTTKSVYTLSLIGESETVCVSSYCEPDTEDSEPIQTCTVNGVLGQVSMSSPELIDDVLKSCKDVKSFEYTSSGLELDKTVVVRRPRGEIYKEIARYLHKTVVLVSISDDRVLEQYISALGIVEVTLRPNKAVQVRNVSSTNFSKSEPCCMYQTSSTLDEVARSYGVRLRK